MPKSFHYAYRINIEIPRTTAYRESLKPYSRSLNEIQCQVSKLNLFVFWLLFKIILVFKRPKLIKLKIHLLNIFSKIFSDLVDSDEILDEYELSIGTLIVNFNGNFTQDGLKDVLSLINLVSKRKLPSSFNQLATSIFKNYFFVSFNFSCKIY